MKMNLTQKIIYDHLDDEQKKIFLEKNGKVEEIDIKIDQTLTHDITAVMAYNAFEALELHRVRTEKSISYIDHNVLCTDHRTSDDHLFLKTIAQKYGIYYSTPGNGICHSVHIARFAIPGKTLLGADSHTASSGAVGMFAFGGGGVEVARAMAGLRIKLNMPKIVKINLIGKLNGGVNAKDIALELLKKYSVKGGVGKVFEYTGEGLKYLEIPQRMTISNMGAEMGATTSIFPTDEITKEFFKAQNRLGNFAKFVADEGATYDDEITIDISKIIPLVACPSQPDNIADANDKKFKDLKVSSVFIGSCTNASYGDIKKAAEILKGKKVSEDVELTIGVSTRAIFLQLLEEGTIAELVKSGARITEIACGACDGIGGAPVSKGITVRTSNRNFKGRSGTVDAQIYLVSPEVAAATAITGRLTVPSDIMTDIEKLNNILEPVEYIVDDSEIIKPLDLEEAKKIQIIRGDNIKPLPLNTKIPNKLNVKVSLKTKDNISTDDITPNDANFSAMRSNIPEISKYAFSRIYPDFVARAKEYGKSVIIGGENYGQGSSREHAAIAPMYLGVKAVIVKSIARIHKKNLINHGVVPMSFKNSEDYDKIEISDELSWNNMDEALEKGIITIKDDSKNFTFEALIELSEEEKEIIMAGGLLPFVKKIFKEA